LSYGVAPPSPTTQVKSFPPPVTTTASPWRYGLTATCCNASSNCRHSIVLSLKGIEEEEEAEGVECRRGGLLLL
jgi:hypothetical protein